MLFDKNGDPVFGSASGGGTTEHASKDTYGIVKVGNNLNVADGVISANPSSAPFPNSFVTNSTTLAFCTSIANTAEAVVGMTYLGALRASDMPFMGNSEVIVRIMTASKVIVLEMFSTDRATNHWYAMYANGVMTTGDATCPWQGIMSINGDYNRGYTPLSDYQAASKKYVDEFIHPSSGTTGQFLQKTARGTTWATVNVPGLKVAACTGMGILRGSGYNTLTWIDPDDVILNGSVITEWVQTVLVVKDGAIPSSHTDGTVIATTSRAAGTKSQYRTEGFVHNPQGGTPYYALFSQASSGDWNNLVANQYPNSGTVYSWGQVSNIVKAGTAPSYWSVGDVFTVEDSEYTHLNGDGVYFMVMGFDQVPTTDQSLIHTMCLAMPEILFNAPSDNGELIYALTLDLLAVTGKTYYTLSGSTYTALVEGVDWNAGDPVPLASWYEKNVNDRQYGSNNWPNSNIRQWANSADPTPYFTPKTIWDTNSNILAAKNGFMRSLDPNFLAAVKKARLTTAKANCDGGGSVVTDDYFWPLSMTQVYGTANNGIMENTQLTYFVNGGEKRKHMMDQATYINWWLRSPYTGCSYYVYYVQSSGSSDYYYARNSYGFSLACIIA